MNIDESSGERSVVTRDGLPAGSRYQTDERQASMIDSCRFLFFLRQKLPMGNLGAPFFEANQSDFAAKFLVLTTVRTSSRSRRN